MQQPPHCLTYALLGTEHNRETKTHSADIIIHRVEYPNEKLTYMHYGYVVDGAYFRKELAMGPVELEWDDLVKYIGERLANALHDTYPVAKDFKLRLETLRKNRKARDRFENAVDKFVGSIANT